jgi:hypothetical protein
MRKLKAIRENSRVAFCCGFDGRFRRGQRDSRRALGLGKTLGFPLTFISGMAFGL